jgi:hypothetical protein
MLALQDGVERLMQGNGSPWVEPWLNEVSWETPLPPLMSRDGALAGLRLLNGMLQQVDVEYALLAAEARLGGATWKRIGSTIGVGPQAAHKRFSKPVNRIIDAARRGHHWQDWPA